MRTFSFFNEKGGVGKSFHTMMFASYLSYKCGAKVLVVDFENPNPRLNQIREDELALLSDSKSTLSRYKEMYGLSENFYTIHAPLKGVDYKYDYKNAILMREAIWGLITSKSFDYILFDFPGLLIEDSPAYDCCVHGQLDLVAVPFDTETMTRRASVLTCSFLKNSKTESVAFWNNVSVAEISREGFLDLGEIIFQRLGIPVMQQRIKSFAKARRDSRDSCFVRSTLCWPDKYINMACPALNDLYAALKDRLDKK